jgi:hypothetical protein
VERAIRVVFFYKEDLNMDFVKILNKERDRLDMENIAKEVEKELGFRKRCDILKPMLDQLNSGMKKMDVDIRFILHTDEKHFPCPAIHIDKSKRLRSLLYHDFGEIYRSRWDGSKRLDHDIWSMGACNIHSNKAETDEDLIEFVVKTIAKKCFERKSLVS